MQPELKHIKPLMKEMNRKKKIVVSSIATIFLIILYCVIFSFSEQDGETSSGVSSLISEKCVAFLKALSGKNWSQMMVEGMAVYFENPIRKLAHFCEYALMGILLFWIWYPWVGLRKHILMQNHKRKAKIPCLLKINILWVFISACFDEIHQVFIPGRDGNIWDVLLDTAGGAFGLLICILWVLVKKGDTNERK